MGFRLVLPALTLLLAAPAAEPTFVANHFVVVGNASNSVIELAATGAADLELPFAVAPNSRYGAAFGPDGRLYVANLTTHRVEILGSDGQKVGELGAGTPLSGASYVAFGPDGHLYVSSYSNDRVLELTLAGDLVREIGVGSGIDGPAGLVLSPDGHLLVVSSLTNAIYEFDANGEKVRTIVGGLNVPWGMTLGANGILYVASVLGGVVKAFTPTSDGGFLVGTIGTGSALQSPQDVALGPNGHLYVCSYSRDSVFEFDALGAFVAEHAVSSTQGAVSPAAIAFAPFRFKAKLAGTIAIHGSDPVALKDKGTVLSVFPGSDRVFLSFTDDPSTSQDLASQFGVSAMTFWGVETSKGADATKRSIHAVHAPRMAHAFDAGSIALRLVGKAGADGCFAAKSATGSLHVSTVGHVVNAKVTTAGLVK
ncbi:MAG TPA: NHL repeat-containing protein [Planctomycetota bacterium]|nr:NHL repeat-containing protein [Planctomycetota bacterium]